MQDLDRIQRLRAIRDLLARGEKATAGDLARRFGVSRRTIQRDLDRLREDGAPVVYDPHDRTLILTDPEWDLPRLRLTEAELLYLLVARQMAEAWRETPLRETLATLFQKIQDSLKEPVSLDTDWVAEQVSFHFSGRGRVRRDHWRILIRALRSARLVQAEYQAAAHPRPATLRLAPLHLACLEGEWYLLARREDPKVRLYALRRFHSISILQARRPLDEEAFDARAFLARRFRRFVESEAAPLKRARIRFDAETARWIEEREWHPEQSLRKHQDGGLTLTLPMTSVPEMRRWVLGWGASARVISPAVLRRAVEEEIQRMAAR